MDKFMPREATQRRQSSRVARINQGELSPPAIERLDDRRILVDRVSDAIRTAILSLELKPGEALIERELAERFGVSKSPVRDALQRLAGDGLVNSSPHRGMTVIRITPDQADEIFELREVLEQLAVRLAVPLLTGEDITAAHAALDRAWTAIRDDDLAGAIIANRAFHDIFSARCTNSLLQETLKRLHDRVHILSFMGWREHPSIRHEHEQHVGICEAAERRDPNLASKLMGQHIQEFREYLRDHYKTAPQVYR